MGIKKCENKKNFKHMLHRKRFDSIKVLIIIAVILIIVTALISSQLNNTEIINRKSEASETDIEDSGVKIASSGDINSIGINENKSIYKNDDPKSIVYFYVTVKRGSKGSKTDNSFDDVNNAVLYSEGEATNSADVMADAIVQVGDERGPKAGNLGYGSSEPNATIRKRGKSSSLAAQYSYALKLNDNAGKWRGQSNIALNKHGFDATRIKNKLYFDMLKEIPDVPSLRTQFVRLFIKDETCGSDEFNDYGVYTQVEVPNKTYLASRGFDSAGYLYKAKMFNFEMSDAIKNFNDPLFNQQEFDKILECKGRQDNTKIINLINAINDTGNDINDVIDRYFDRNNYENWLAYNILMGNNDTNMQNFYLYSPVNSEKWYFIPWDGDGSLSINQDKTEKKERAEWQKGIMDYWGVSLHKRFFKDPENLKELENKVNELKKIITKEKIENLIQSYTETIDPYVTSMPDILHLIHTPEERNSIISQMPDEIDINADDFTESLSKIMPFFLGEPQFSENEMQFSWENAYDFQNKEMDYHFVLSTNPDMSSPIYDIDNKESITLSVPALESGTYYWSVYASTEDGRTVKAFDYIEINDIHYYGVKKLII